MSDTSVSSIAVNSAVTWFPDDPEPGCGYGPFRTGEDDPFYSACVIHDIRYGEHSAGTEAVPLTREEVDREFLRNMERIAGDNWLLQLRARVYYVLARVFGGFLW